MGQFMLASAHLNLNDEYLPYKYVIGQVILDVCAFNHVHSLENLTNVTQKNKRVKTVVNKLDSIDTKFRFFKMELLAGEPDYVVEHVGSPLSSEFLSR
jgi:tRNA (guanine37-N1)-methyltransferase